MKIEIAVLEDMKGILEVLNTATKKLLDLKVNQWEYPWEAALIEGDIKGKLQYTVKEEQRTIAVFLLRIFIPILGGLRTAANSAISIGLPCIRRLRGGAWEKLSVPG